MDWDWEDGPPREVPRGVPRDGSRRPEDSPPPAADTPSFADAVEHFDQTAQPDDDERTQVIRRQPPGDEEPLTAERPVDAPPPAPETPSFSEVVDRFEAPILEPHPPRSDLEGPRLRTIEAAQRSMGAGAQDRRPGERPPRLPADRAAARARRRKQIRRRRIVALAVIVAIVVLLVVLVLRGCGGPAEGQAATEPVQAVLIFVVQDWLPPVLMGGQ